MADGAASRAGGTHAVCWSQTEADGLPSPPPEALVAGVAWCWHGRAWRIERPWAPLLLAGSDAAGLDGAGSGGGGSGDPGLRRRAARVAHRLSGLAPRDPGADLPERPEEPPAGGFLLTDGYRTWAACVLHPAGGGEPLVAFAGGAPPPGAELWIVAARLGAMAPGGGRPRGGVICFTPGTRLATPGGARAIEALRPGDRVLTADNGPQPVLWAGRRRLSGARLCALPQLRPVRIRAAALGAGRPEATLVVSPQHRLLVRGPAPRALWNTPEVLVAAADLVDDRLVTVDWAAREVTYVHILLEAHQIVWANGVASESFHPAAAEGSLSTADAAAIAALIGDPAAYGAPARRPLDAAEAAILRHDARMAAA
jgi:hypothetical protein